MVRSLWDGLRRQPVHVACWALFIAIFGWATARSFPTGFDPDADRSGGRGSDFVYYYHGAEGFYNGTDPYARFQYGHRDHHAYNYPPMMAILLSPLVRFGMVGAAQVWFSINALLAMLLFVAWFRVVADRFGLTKDLLSQGAVLSLAAVVGVELVRREIDDHQTDTLMLASLLGMTVAMDRGRTPLPDGRRGLPARAWVWPALAGLSLAFGIHVKFLLLAFLPYLVVTNRLRVAGFAVLWTGVIVLATAAVSGWEENLRHYALSLGGATSALGAKIDSAELIGRVHDVSWVQSVSVPSMFARVTGGGATESLTHPHPDYDTKLVFGLAGVVAAACVGLAWAMYRAHGHKLFAMFWSRRALISAASVRRFALIEVCMMIVAQLAFSPQTMKRHMFLAVPVILLACGTAIIPRRGAAWWASGVALVVLLAGLTLPPGTDSTRELVAQWKWYSGPGWSLLVFAFLTMWGALSTHGAIERGEALLDPPPPRSRWIPRRATPPSA